MFKNSHPFLKISSMLFFSYLDDSNKLAKGFGKFGRIAGNEVKAPAAMIYGTSCPCFHLSEPSGSFSKLTPLMDSTE